VKSSESARKNSLVALPHNGSGLVLTAGGARGAYQAGVLKRLGQISSLKDQASPFQIIAGASAGAINGAGLAAHSDNFTQATQKLSDLWSELKAQNIYRTDLWSLSQLTGQFLKDLALGKIIGGGHAQSFLDASPLRDFLSKHLDFEGIQSSIDRGCLYAVAITATNYYSGKSFTFIQGQKGHPTWEKTRRIALSAQLNIEHICASAAIPMIFQPVLVHTHLGDFYFGDGGLRLITPLSPAIRLGAERVFAIGIRSQKGAEERWKQDLLSFQTNRPVMKKPPMAQVIGVILNSIFLDHLDADVEHLNRMNELIESSSSSQSRQQMNEPVRPIQQFVIKPSVDLGQIADLHTAKMPGLVRYFLEGLGSSQSESADLASYLLFDQAYTRDLIDLGFKDASRQVDEIEEFLLGKRNNIAA
jgi:NTE family protein